MKAYHIHIEGQVQGVGFRPYLWRMAHEFGLTGWVSNGVNGVHLEIGGEEDQCQKFYHRVIKNAPANSRITKHSIDETEYTEWVDFQIKESNATGIANLLVTPDLGICNTCKQGILSAETRRYHYPFTTCTQCGPRYSIIKALPYDRITTTMKEFQLCPNCFEEYHSPTDRRYYSQTNSCPDCAIALSLLDSTGQLLTSDTEAIIQETISLLAAGRIIAMKGIGGYLLLCDASNPQTIDLLRARKHRPSKPFALLYPSLSAVQQDAFISNAEADALLSVEAPIVVVKVKQEIDIALEGIAPNLDHIGVMLPYTPLMVLLMDQWNKPLVATSANESGSPIFYQDNQALQQLQGIADYFITNNRDIVVPQDDSVVRFTQDDQRIILRRSRGLAPTFLPHSIGGENETWLAMGSDMKSSFAMLHQNNVYISQYLGDLENYQTQESYENALRHWQQLLGAAPKRIIVDKHPIYFSSALGNRFAHELQVPCKMVQHHQAHLCAVLAENNLLETSEPTLGVIWDGTGWGDDHNVWGGEFFRYESGNIDRVAHLDYFNHFLGDKFSKEPRLSALSFCQNISEANSILKPKFTDAEWSLYTKILSQPDGLKTSSMGRLFDGVASLLGLCDRSSYEGEAALYLETVATRYKEDSDELTSSLWTEGNFSLHAILQQLIAEINTGTSNEAIAYHFHLYLVKWIEEVASRENVTQLAFSGGVFQNALLVHLIQKQLGKRFALFFHHQLSPNDESISFGQLAWQHLQLRLRSNARTEKSKHSLVTH